MSVAAPKPLTKLSAEELQSLLSSTGLNAPCLRAIAAAEYTGFDVFTDPTAFCSEMVADTEARTTFKIKPAHLRSLETMLSLISSQQLQPQPVAAAAAAVAEAEDDVEDSAAAASDKKPRRRRKKPKHQAQPAEAPDGEERFCDAAPLPLATPPPRPGTELPASNNNNNDDDDDDYYARQQQQQEEAQPVDVDVLLPRTVVNKIDNDEKKGRDTVRKSEQAEFQKLKTQQVQKVAAAKERQQQRRVETLQQPRKEIIDKETTERADIAKLEGGSRSEVRSSKREEFERIEEQELLEAAAKRAADKARAAAEAEKQQSTARVQQQAITAAKSILADAVDFKRAWQRGKFLQPIPHDMKMIQPMPCSRCQRLGALRDYMPSSGGGRNHMCPLCIWAEDYMSKHHNADPTTPERLDRQAVAAAARQLNISDVQRLCDDTFSMSCLAGNVPFCRTLTAALGVQYPSARFCGGDTYEAMYRCAGGGSVAMAKWLIEKGAPGVTPNQLAEALCYGHLSLGRFFLEECGGKSLIEGNVLFECVWNTDAFAFIDDYLSAHLTSSEIRRLYEDRSPQEGATLLTHAVGYGCPAATIKRILARKMIDVDDRAEANGFTALGWAKQKKLQDVVKLLLQAGAKDCPAIDMRAARQQMGGGGGGCPQQ